VRPTSEETQVIYWHGQLPPLEAEPMGEHVVEAVSKRVKRDLAQHPLTASATIRKVRRGWKVD
jgi:hypothetical protein